MSIAIVASILIEKFHLSGFIDAVMINAEKILRGNKKQTLEQLNKVG